MSIEIESTAVPESPTGSTASIGKPLLTGPKRQHFLPRFYLEGFAKDGVVAVFDRESNTVRVQQPINTGVIGHFYTLEDEEGRKRFELEAVLEEYETKAKPIISKLAAATDIDAEERSNLSMFVSLAAFRTPDMIESLKMMNSHLVGNMAKRIFSDVDVVKQQMRSKPEGPLSDDELEQEARALVEYVQNGQYEVRTEHKWAVRTAINMALTIAPVFAGRDWTVFHRDSEKKSFITSDAPVLLTAMTPQKSTIFGIGFGSSDALVLFSLNESSVLAMHGNQGMLAHRSFGTEQIRRINLAIGDHCQRFVIGRDELLVRSIVDHLDLANKSWRPKMQPA